MLTAAIALVLFSAAGAARAESTATEIVVKVKAPADRPGASVSSAQIENAQRVLRKRLPSEVEITRGRFDSRTFVLRVPPTVSADMVEMRVRMRGILDFREATSGGRWTIVMGDFPITSAAFATPPPTQARSPLVRVQLSPEGAREFSIVTARLIGKPLGIFLDDQLLCCPTVQTPIRGGALDISGFETDDEARTVAAVLDAGTLGVELRILRRSALP